MLFAGTAGAVARDDICVDMSREYYRFVEFGQDGKVMDCSSCGEQVNFRWIDNYVNRQDPVKLCAKFSADLAMEQGR